MNALNAVDDAVDAVNALNDVDDVLDVNEAIAMIAVFDVIDVIDVNNVIDVNAMLSVVDVDGVSVAEVLQAWAVRRVLDECLEQICLVEVITVCPESSAEGRYEEEFGVRQGTILAFGQLGVLFFCM